GPAMTDYLLSALIIMAEIRNRNTHLASSLLGAIRHRPREELSVAPVTTHVILPGYTSGGVAGSLAVCLIGTRMSLFLTRLQVQHISLTIGVVFLRSLVFSLGGFINAVYARSFADISIVPTFVLTPLTYLGGVFYSINLLPDFWQGVSLINPILHMVNAFRFGILGVSDINIGIALGLMAVFVVGLYLFSYRLLVRGVGLR